MANTILVVGYGPGISTAVAEKFGASGLSVALVARNKERLDAGVKALEAKGIKAAAFPADASDPAAMAAVVAKARTALGPISVIEWTAYGGGPSDILTGDAASLRSIFDVAVVGLLATVHAALPDLKETKGSVLVTNGAFGEIHPQVDAYAVSVNATSLALANAAKHKLVGLLSERLKKDGVFVGEVMVAGTVKGTAWDSGNATIDPKTIADKFWELHQARDAIRARVA